MHICTHYSESWGTDLVYSVPNAIKTVHLSTSLWYLSNHHVITSVQTWFSSFGETLSPKDRFLWRIVEVSQHFSHAWFHVHNPLYSLPQPQRLKSFLLETFGNWYNHATSPDGRGYIVLNGVWIQISKVALKTTILTDWPARGRIITVIKAVHLYTTCISWYS